MHLRSAVGPINVLLLNQDQGLSSLIPTQQQQQQQQQQQSPSMDMDTTQHQTDTTITATIASSTAVDDISRDSATCNSAESAGVKLTEVPLPASPSSSGGGMVTRRRSRRQAELVEEGMDVVGESREGGGGGGSGGERGDGESGEGESGKQSGSVECETCTNEEQPMETNKVCLCVCTVHVFMDSIAQYVWACMHQNSKVSSLPPPPPPPPPPTTTTQAAVEDSGKVQQQPAASNEGEENCDNYR